MILPTMNHHMLAKATTDAILSNFKTGKWNYGKGWGADFLRTVTPADFPSPDAAFYDDTNKKLVYFEFKPDTETKRGILTGVGQGIAYLESCNLSYLIAPKMLAGFDLESYLTDLYKHQLSSVPSGLIVYDNSTPADVKMVKNVNNLAGTASTARKVAITRYWAKHQDLPIPLFHLILHYYYLKKVGIISGDAFEFMYTHVLVPPSVLSTLTPVEVKDVEGNVIRTVAGTKSIKHFEKKLLNYKKLPSSAKPAEMANLKAQINPATPGDTNYQSIRKNYLSFVKQLHMVDSMGNITDQGLAIYNLGLVNGPTSKIFKDYFIKELLTTGHHLDLLLDLDSMQKRVSGTTNVLLELESDYMSRGLIKLNPNRIVGKTKTVSFLKYERILWKALGLVDKADHVNWKLITEVCSLPEIY